MGGLDPRACGFVGWGDTRMSGFTPTFPDGFHCSHGYPPGECCPACGEIPDPMAGVLVDDCEDDFGSSAGETGE